MASSTENDSFTNCEYEVLQTDNDVDKEKNQITIDEVIQALNYNNLIDIDVDDDDLQTDVYEETGQILPNIFDIIYSKVPISREQKDELKQKYTTEYSKADEVKEEHYMANNDLEYNNKGDEENENKNEIDEIEEGGDNDLEYDDERDEEDENENEIDEIEEGEESNLEYDNDEGNGENEDENDEIEEGGNSDLEYDDDGENGENEDEIDEIEEGGASDLEYDDEGKENGEDEEDDDNEDVENDFFLFIILIKG